ncbi:MAG: substrate-binding domain-containing protein [Ignavibacteriales bacterium]|nr:substrate-binding domain-containing protein [Ignavibacteriales bacterium]
MRQTCIVCTFVIVAILAVAGCSTTQKEQPKKRIAGIVFQEDQFFRLVLFGMRDAAKKSGVELLEANSAGKPDKEVELINTYIANAVDAIVISPLSARASVAALTRAHEKGITIITYNTPVEGDLAASFVESDQVDLGASTGRAARAYIEHTLKGKAKIAIISGKSQVPEQAIMRINGFRDEVLKLPGVSIVSEQDAWLAEQATKKVGDILTANPDIDIVWSANEGGTVGAVMAVRNAGKAGKVCVFGTDISDQLSNFLLDDDGVLRAITGQQPFEIGSMAADAAVKALKGQPVEKKTSLPGILLTREKPDDIRKFKQRLKELTQ